MQYVIQKNRSFFGAVVALALMLFPGLMRGQTTTSFGSFNGTAVPLTSWHLYAGANFIGSYSNLQFRATVSSGFTNPIELDAINLPSGVTASFSTNFYTNSVATVILTVNVANAAKGTFPLTIQASNTVTSATFSTNLLTVVLGNLWTNANPAVVTWNNAANWTLGVPVNGDNVMFQDGTDTNFLDYSVTLASLTYLRNSNGFAQNTALAPGVVLGVTNGFAANVQSITGLGKTTVVSIYGAGASLVVTNSSVDFDLGGVTTSTAGSTYNLTNLDNFTAYVNRFGVSDVSLAEQGGFGQSVVFASFAKTNVINASFVSDYTVTSSIPFAVSIFRNGDDNNNGSPSTVNLGLSNSIVADSIGIGQGRAGSTANTVRFNPVFTNSTLFPVPTLYVRGTNGGRVTLMGVAADSGLNAPGSNCSGVEYFDNGTVDMLINEMWLGRTRFTNTSAGLSRATLQFNAGTININNLHMGYQFYTNNDSGAQGTLNVSGTGVLTVNNTLEMGYVAGYATASHNTTQGTISLKGGQILANIITTGQTNNLGANTITLNGGELVVSNTIADPVKPLTTLTITGGRLTLLLNQVKTTPYVFTSALSIPTASAGELKIASVQGYTFPTNVPLIQYGGIPTVNFSNVIMPSGLQGNVIQDGSVANQLDLQILSSVPKNLVWRGATSSDWTTSPSAKNWLDLGTGLITNFDNGDFVTFDDTAAVPTSINLVDGSMTPKSVTVTNTNNHYSFGGTGSLVGSAGITKFGTNALDINASAVLAVTVNQGSVTGSGTIASLSVNAGASANFAGTINTGVNCAGTATLSGNTSGGLAVLTGGSVSQLGNLDGVFTVAANAQLYNQGTLNNTGTSTTATNSTFLNSGNINASSMTIGGAYTDTGGGTLTMSNVTTINGNATFIVGNADGHSRVEIDGIGNATAFPQRGRLLLSNNSTNIFGVNADNGNANEADTFSVDFGNNNTLSGGGSVIIITNVGVNPLAAGQSYRLFENENDPGFQLYEAGTNTAAIIQPGAPGPGLAWDTRTLRQDGRIKIISVGTSAKMAFNFSITNNLVLFTSITTNTSTQVVTTNYSTNKAAIILFNWPATNVGWRLQQQISTTPQGIRDGSSNWTYVYPSWWTNGISVTNNFQSNAADFYRLVYP